MAETLLIIDGNSLLYRGFHALPLLSSKGVYTNAIQGFMGMLLKAIQEKTPTYCTVAFDEYGPTFRHEIYEEYKAGRKPTPEELKMQFPLMKELLTLMGIGVISLQGYEADDILGTFAKQGEKLGVNPLLLTGDKDALQLVNDTTHVLFTKRGISETIEFDPQTLYETYGVYPEQVIDWKGLMGDSSDNIPGVPGVGEKTATKLLKEYGNMENIYLHSEEIKGKLGEKIRDHKELAYFSKELATINTQVPLQLNLEEIKLTNLQGAIPFFREYQMVQMEKRLMNLLNQGNYGENTIEEKVETLPKIQWIDLRTMEEIEKEKKLWEKEKEISLFLGEGLSLYFPGINKGYRMSFAYSLLEEGLIPQQVLKAIAPVMENKAFVTHGAKDFYHLLAKEELAIPQKIQWDTMIGAYLLNPQEKSYTFENLYPDLSPDAFTVYIQYQNQREEIVKEDMADLMETIELPLSKVLFLIEQRGFQVDKQVLESLGKTFNEQIASLTQSIYESTGVEGFNINSPQQLGKVLFDTLGLPTGKKKKTGYSTSAEVLENLVDLHPSIEMILNYRQINKLNGTYIEGLLKLIGEDGRIHSTFEQTGTATGRISSNEPNLQNIPVRTPIGREIRKAFIPKEGWFLIDADYSQIELRVLAHLSEDKAMTEAFKMGQDIHTRTAAEVYGIKMEEVTGSMRSSAKAVNFGLVYGISDFGLAKNIGIGVKEAGDFIKTYFSKYPGIKKFMDEAVTTGKEKGYATTIFGRRRYLPELNSPNYNVRNFGERVAMNAPIQGSAADIIKKAMVMVEERLKEEKMEAKLILQVHDELLLEAPPHEVEKASILLKEIMEKVVSLKVPLIAEVNFGKNWYETK